jgi:SAM-dependent methyltransferase
MSVGGYYEDYWSEAGFNPVRPVNTRLYKVLATHLPPQGDVLDLGCGDGRTLGLWIRDHVGHYVGVDVSATAVERARSLGLDARTISDAAELPFEDDSLDAVVSIEVLEHLFSPHEAAAEVHRVLRPGGVFLATVPNVAYWRWRRDMALRGIWNPYGDEDSVDAPWRDPHVRFFTAETLERMLGRAGFASVEVGGFEGEVLGAWRLAGVARSAPALRERLHRRIERSLLPLLGMRLHAVARKAG